MAWVQLVTKDGKIVCGPEEFGTVPGSSETFRSGDDVYRITGTRQHSKMRVPLPSPAERMVTIVTVDKIEEKAAKQTKADRNHPVRG